MLKISLLILGSCAALVVANVDIDNCSSSSVPCIESVSRSDGSDSVPSLQFSSLLSLTSMVTLVAAALVAAAYAFSSQPLSAPPSYSYLFPLVRGKLDVIRRGPLELVRAGRRKCGDIFRIRIGYRHITFLVGVEAQAVFFEAKETQFTQKEVYGFSVPVFGDGVVYGADPHIFLQQLKLLSKGLSSNALATYVPKIVNETVEFFALLPTHHQRFDLFTAISELTINTASRCLLGPEIRNRVQKEFAEHFHSLSAGMTPFTFFAPTFPTPGHRRRDAAREAICRIFSSVLAERKLRLVPQQQESSVTTSNQQASPIDANSQSTTTSSPASQEATPQDFLQLLLESAYTSGEKLSDGEISGLLLAALFAGQHTSNITTTWLILSILHSPRREEIISHILAEHDREMAESQGVLTFEALAKMSFLTACIRETLRLFPPLILLMRYARQAVPYKQYVIPQGDIVIVSPAVSGRLEEVYVDPDTFDPWRFLEPRLEDTRHKYAFFGFGGGRHQCLGERFAMMQIKTIACVLLREFEMKPINSTLPELDLEALVVGPKLPVFVEFTRKQHSLHNQLNTNTNTHDERQVQ